MEPMKRALVLLLFATLALACKNDGGGTEGKSGGESQTTGNTASKDFDTRKLDIRDADGKPLLTLEPSPEGYKLRDPSGAKVGKVKIDGPKLKIKDASGKVLAKAKQKDAGFKVYRGDDVVLFKMKRKDGGFKLKKDDDTEIGRLKGSTLKVIDGEISVAAGAEAITVKRSGNVAATVNRVSPAAASYLGLTEYSLHERVAAMLAHMRWGQ
jgi:hypothetical protein